MRTDPDPVPSAGHRVVSVAIGPSLSSQAAPIQSSLGPDFRVVGVLDAPRSGRDDSDVAVLGTHELPSGEILVRAGGNFGVIIVGLPHPSDPRGDAGAAVDSVVAAVLGLVARMTPAA